ncbi:MAG: glycoside hydrolase family 172 protein [Candidatus Thorarchaeota archaeon]
MEFGFNSLSNLAKINKDVRRKRISSYDKSGANADMIIIEGKDKYEICNLNNSGIIKHIWMTLASQSPYYLREVLIRMWWDGEKEPSVEVPIGDFFGVGHGKTVNFWSLPLSMGPQDGKGFNCFFPMPFSKRAKIEIENESDLRLVCYFYIDYEEYDEIDSSFGRFHAMWNRVNPCQGQDYEYLKTKNLKSERFSKKNPSHEDDYLLLSAEGEGHYVGCHVDIHNLFETERFNWPGEGDDYIEIDDGEIILYGTGTEDYFCGSWCPTQFYCSPYFGVTLTGGKNWSGKISYYRYHIEDPIYFHKNIKVKIEHGHANQRSDDWSSTSYFYQREPHSKFKEMLPVNQRLPRELPKEIEDEK